MPTAFESIMRAAVTALADRLSITETRAFAVWYGTTALRLDEQEALEATSFDGGNDRGTDFFYVDDEADRVIIAQWKYFQSSSKTPKAGDLTQLFNVPDELADPQELRDEGRSDLAEAAEALAEARAKGYEIDLRFLYPGVKNEQRDRESRRLVRSFNRTHTPEALTATLVSLDELQLAYDDFAGSAGRVQQGTLAIVDDRCFEQDDSYGHSLVATISGDSLRSLYLREGNRLFDQNVRLFLGTRKGSVNAGIRDTLDSTIDRGNFWAYNNGITIVARGVALNREHGSVDLTDFSIVNGCQTTVSIGEASDTAAQRVNVLARIVAADESALIENIIRYTNSQTPISLWDISARDKLQQRLRRELEQLPDPWFYALRRGELETVADKTIYGSPTNRRILPFPLSAQYLAAFRGFPVEAYKDKALLFSTHRSRVFPPDTEARDLLWAWAVGRAVEASIPDVKSQLGESEVVASVLKRGARFFATAVAGQLLRAQNGNDFVARVGISSLFGAAMTKRLAKYAAVAVLYYVSIMRDQLERDIDLGRLIRNTDTHRLIEERVTERLAGERLAPRTLAEKLPKLPGVSSNLAASG
jgi:hypothetical protein